MKESIEPRKYDEYCDEQYMALNEKYMELIMAVATKFPNESRHETALRYIEQAENRSNIACEAQVETA